MHLIRTVGFVSYLKSCCLDACRAIAWGWMRSLWDADIQGSRHWAGVIYKSKHWARGTA